MACTVSSKTSSKFISLSPSFNLYLGYAVWAYHMPSPLPDFLLSSRSDAITSLDVSPSFLVMSMRHMGLNFLPPPEPLFHNSKSLMRGRAAHAMTWTGTWSSFLFFDIFSHVRPLKYRRILLSCVTTLLRRDSIYKHYISILFQVGCYITILFRVGFCVLFLHLFIF